MSVALLFTPSAHAQAPKDATAKCGDGTYSTSKTKRGACSKHGGIDKWLADESPAKKSESPVSETRAKTPVSPERDTAPLSAAPAGAPKDATAQCNDGTYSFAKHHSGACSSHKGVKTFFK